MNDPDAPEIVELERYEPAAPTTLFGTSDPDAALARMSKLASVLVDVIRDRGLVVRISGREHLTAEAWTTLGGMLGVVPIVEWTRPLEDGSGWEARVEARTLDGKLVGAAESMCTRSEATWRTRDEYSLRSMAQTRAIGRALRAPLGQIVRLAGYDPTGAEELPTIDRTATRTDPEPPRPAASGPASPDQLAQVAALIRSLERCEPDTDWKTRAHQLARVPATMLTQVGADVLIQKLEIELATKVEQR